MLSDDELQEKLFLKSILLEWISNKKIIIQYKV